MTASPLPTSVDLRALAKQGDSLSGHHPLSAYQRLSSDLPGDEAAKTCPVIWTAHPEHRERLGTLASEAQGRVAGGPQLWLHLQAQAEVPQICQRCLTPTVEHVEVDRWFRFVADEATAATEDDESEEDVLVLEPRFNLHELIEDELLMALPLVPMHNACPVSVHMSAGDLEVAVEEAERPHPFAALAALKAGGGGSKTGA
jgi:uncharacterized protein